MRREKGREGWPGQTLRGVGKVQGRSELVTKSQGSKNEVKPGSAGMRKLGEREPKGYKEENCQQRCQKAGGRGGEQHHSPPSPRGMSPPNPSLCKVAEGASGRLTGWC